MRHREVAVAGVLQVGNERRSSHVEAVIADLVLISIERKHVGSYATLTAAVTVSCPEVSPDDRKQLWDCIRIALSCMG